MQIRLILNLSLFGLLPGVIQLTGFGQQFEWILWVGFWVFTSFLFAKREVVQIQFHAGLTGFLFAVLAFAMKALLMDNPQSLDSTSMQAAADNPRVQLFSLGLLLAVGNGIVNALFAIGIAKSRNK